MAEEKMPAAEAAHDSDVESNHYEFAYHVLPTVAEGEVAGVIESLKAHITKAGGAFTIEESPQRIDLAYEIVKPVDGKNRKFASAYFGWVRFTLNPDAVAELTEELEGMPELLRSITIKLTLVEEAEPFYYHEAMASEKKVSTVGEEDVKPVEDDSDADVSDDDSDTEVKEEELEVSLEKITQ